MTFAAFFATAATADEPCISEWDNAIGQPGIPDGCPFPPCTPQATEVQAFAEYGGELIAAGWFFEAGGETAKYIARWDGSTWNPFPAAPSDWIRALLVYEGDLIAGGQFTSIGGIPASKIARWDGSSWHPIGGGVHPWPVYALAEYNGELIAGGGFDTADDGVIVNRIARWDGSSWKPLGVGMNGTVQALTVYNGDLIAGGSFTAAGGVFVGRIARWDGTAWHSMGGVEGQVHSLTVYNGELIVGGNFLKAGGVLVNHIARWDGSIWQPLGDGCISSFEPGSCCFPASSPGGGCNDSECQAAVCGCDPFCCNVTWDFHCATTGWPGTGDGDCGAQIHCPELCPNPWHHTCGMGSAGTSVNFSPIVFSLATYNGDLIAGGHFTTAGGETVNNIARWDGETGQWHGMSENCPGSWEEGCGMGHSTGPPGIVFTLGHYENRLIAGGWFTTAFGLPSNRVAAWSGCVDPKPGVPGDLTGDGSVGVSDLLILLANWGPCTDPSPGGCPADLTGDGSVGVADLLILLANWG